MVRCPVVRGKEVSMTMPSDGTPVDDMMNRITELESEVKSLHLRLDAREREALEPMAKHYNELVKACSPEPLSDKVVAAIGLLFTRSELEAAAQAVEGVQ